MAQIGAPSHDAVPIGEVSAPPFARLPLPGALFRQRAARFRDLADGHALEPYLRFLAGLADAQDAVLAEVPPVTLPPAAALARSREHAMPALDRLTLVEGAVFAVTLRRFLARAAAVDVPDEARLALATVAARDTADLAAMARDVLDGAIPPDAVAEHVLVAAALQVHAARLAAQLDPRGLVAVGDGVCPACGSAPVASLVVGWQGAHGARFCACSLCGTLWNYVRIRCTACGSTKGISYQELAGGDGAVKAECCAECRTQVKVMQQLKHPALDPVADDVATAALDVLVGESGVRRGGVNPFLLGY